MIFHTLPRASRSAITSSLPCPRNPTNLVRSYQSSARYLSPMFEAVHHTQTTSLPQQSRSAHAIANPTLAGIEKRWEGMPPQEQAELWMQLRDRMKVDWNEMTLQEKKAAWWIAFGPHGPRAEDPPGEWGRVMWYTLIGVGVSGILFYAIHSFARPAPRTMTKEWQEATNEYLRKEKVNPIYGISSEGYKGKGHVQSKPAKSRGITLEPDE